MDFFEKIEEYELKASETLKNRITIFTKISNDLDDYLKCEKDFDKDFNIDKNTKELINEIKNSKVKDLMQLNILEEVCKIEHVDTISTIYENSREYCYDHKKLISDLNYNSNSFVILDSEFVDYFNQDSFANKRKFYSRNNEIENMKGLILDQLKENINKKLYAELHERECSYKVIRKIDNVKRSISKYSRNSVNSGNSGGSGVSNRSGRSGRSGSSNNSKKSKKKKGKKRNHTSTLVKVNSSIKEIQLSNSTYMSQQNINKIENYKPAPINYNAKFLYPEPKKKEDLLKTKFVFNKIYEFKYHGHLHKKFEIADIKKELKLNKEKPNYNFNVIQNLEIVDKLMKQRKFNIKNVNGLNFKNEMSKAGNFDPETKKANDIMVDTKSDFLIRINRNLMDLKLSKCFLIYLDLRKGKEGNEYYDINKKNNRVMNFEKNFFNNVTTDKVNSTKDNFKFTK